MRNERAQIKCWFVSSQDLNYVAQTGLGFTVLPPQARECWNYRHAPPCLHASNTTSGLTSVRACQFRKSSVLKACGGRKRGQKPVSSRGPRASPSTMQERKTGPGTSQAVSSVRWASRGCHARESYSQTVVCQGSGTDC